MSVEKEKLLIALEAAYRACVIRNPLPLDLYVDSLGLCGEAGEVAEAVKKLSWAKEGFVGLTEDDVEHYEERLKAELGDVMFHWLRLVDLMGLSVEYVLSTLARKIEDRNLNNKKRQWTSSKEKNK